MKMTKTISDNIPVLEPISRTSTVSKKRVKQNFKRTEAIKLCFNEATLIGFIPNESQLKKQSTEFLCRLYLAKLHYYQGGALYNPTFEFSNGAISPPKDSYWEEPSNTANVQQDRDNIGKIIYGVDDVQFPYLVSL